MLTLGSLFSGIGGFDVAFHNAGVECKWQVEIDKPCRDVLAHHFPDVRRYEDVKEVGQDNLEPVDVIVGGFPCQDLSIAGKRKGLTGERSGLWFEFARVIDELEPRWVVIENVPGLLSSDGGRDFAIIIRWLAERGYGVSWRILDAQYFGLAQRRRRVFIVGSFGGGDSAKVLFESEGGTWDSPPSREKGKAITAGTGEGVSSTLRGFGHGWQGQHNDTNAVVVNRMTAFGEYTDDDIPSTVKERDYKDATDLVVHKSKSIGIGHSGGVTLKLNEQANTVNTQTGSETTAMFNGVFEESIAFQQNTRDEVRLMGGDGNIAGALASQPGMKQQNFIWEAGSQDGIPRVHHDGVSPTLNTMKGGLRQPIFGIRRLTPTECERLQGFEDGWTDKQSDSARYRQLGNAVAVPVVQWIAERIIQVEEENEQ